MISEKTAEYWIEGAKKLKKEFPNKILVGSLMATYNEADWRELTRMCKDAKFDFIEVNLSCPHGMTELGMGRACGEDPVMVENITKWVAEETDLPVIVKLTPNYTDTYKIA